MQFKIAVKKLALPSLVGTILVGLTLGILYISSSLRVKTEQYKSLETEKAQVESTLAQITQEFETFKNQDQILINKNLTEEIANIQKTYKTSVTIYEELLKLKEGTPDKKAIAAMDDLFALSLTQLSDRNYASASSNLSDISTKIKVEQSRLAALAAAPIPANTPESNTPPGSGYSRQSVSSDAGTFLVSMVAGDLGSTRVIVDTASDSDCGNDCPVLPLATYVARSGAYAGINGSYFCPASYPSCAGKTNTFDLLVMNKNKYYFNSGNNVYSTNPAVIFGGGYIRFVGAAQEWGRDTGVDGVLSNYPLLVSGGNVTFGGNDDPKQGSKGNRSFVANKGNTVYIGVVHSATVAEAARVLKALGMDNGLNLDNGGSTALWSGGYKVGPGRDLPNVILFVRK